MIATLASVALALISPLIGFRYERDGIDDVRRSSPTIVHPVTLKPVADAPRLPRGAKHFERSPDGDALAALDGNDVVLASTRTGEPLGRVPVGGEVVDTQEWDPVLSWISANRILVIDKVGARCPPYCRITRVRVVDPVARTVVGDPLTFEGDFRTARIAGRQLLVVHPYINGGETSWGDGSGVPRVVIFDGAGRIVHRFELTGYTLIGGLDRDLVSGYDEATGRDVVSRIDVRTGTVAAQRTYGLHHENASGGAAWLVPAPGRDTAWLTCNCNGRGPFDRSSLEARRPLPKDHSHVFALTSTGFLTLVQSERNPNERLTLTARRRDGTRRWRREVYRDGEVAMVGRYVYAEHYHDDRGYFTDVIRLRDGRRVAHLPGRRVLSEISAGRSIEQVPRLEGNNYLD